MTLEALAGKYGYPLDMISRYLRKVDRNARETVELQKIDTTSPGIAAVVAIDRALATKETLARLDEAYRHYREAVDAGDKEAALKWHRELSRITDMVNRTGGAYAPSAQVAVGVAVGGNPEARSDQLTTARLWYLIERKWPSAGTPSEDDLKWAASLGPGGVRDDPRYRCQVCGHAEAEHTVRWLLGGFAARCQACEGTGGLGRAVWICHPPGAEEHGVVLSAAGLSEVLGA